MIHPDDPPALDVRRLARWRNEPAPRRGASRDPRATPHAVVAAHGGEVAFWLAWLRGEVNAELQAWFRQQAEHDADLRNDLRSIEHPYGSGHSTRAARAELRNALEACNYLTESHGAGPSGLPSTLVEVGELTETDLVLGQPGSDRENPAVREANQAELRRRIRSGLFGLLEEVEIHVAPANEASEGTRLLEHLVGLPAVSKFVQLQQLQVCPRPSPPLLRDRLLRAVAPELFAREGEGFRYRLSFRLFLRARLQHYCRERGWLPAGPRFRDLPTAFAALGRERIGALVRGLLASRDVFQAVGVPCQQLGVLLETLP
jgi:hypothetical protein